MSALHITIGDLSFVASMLALRLSMARVGPGNPFHFYCLDQGSQEILVALNLPNTAVFGHEDFIPEDFDQRAVHLCQTHRCWAVKPLALAHALRNLPLGGWAVYTDADMMAFSDPAVVLPDDPSVIGLTTPHRFLPSLQSWGRLYGWRNAGYYAARNTPESQGILSWWGEQCLVPSLVPERFRLYDENSGRFLDVVFDQKVVDALAEDRTGVATSDHPGLNDGPWNLPAKQYKMKDGRTMVNGHPLLLYHFQGMRIYSGHLFDVYPGLFKAGGDVVDCVYRPHAKLYREAVNLVRGVRPDWRAGRHALLSRSELKRLAVSIIRRGFVNIRLFS